MEAGVGRLLFDAGALEEGVPGFGEGARALVGLGGAPGSEFLEERDEFGVERLDGMTTTFLHKTDDRLGAEFDVAHGVEIRLGQAHAVVSRDEVAVAKEGAEGFGFALDGGFDLGELFVGQLWSNALGLSADAQFAAGVVGGVAAGDGLPHDASEDFEFEQCRVVAGAVFAAFWVALGAPLQVGGAVFPVEQLGRCDAFFFEEHGQGAPCGLVAFERFGFGGVCGLNEFGHPGVPGGGAVWGAAGFFEGFDGLKFSGGAGVAPDADAQAGALPDNISARIPKFDPPERGVLAFVNASHVRVPQCAQARKTIQSK